MTNLQPMQLPDAEALCSALAEAMRPCVDPGRTALVGIHTGGVWVAERLHAALGLKIPSGSMDVSFYRDDFNQRGLHANAGPRTSPSTSMAPMSSSSTTCFTPDAPSVPR
jgi:pyrimidine operon attenuation protein/uracil phosphoribosyltransferase